MVVMAVAEVVVEEPENSSPVVDHQCRTCRLLRYSLLEQLTGLRLDGRFLRKFLGYGRVLGCNGCLGFGGIGRRFESWWGLVGSCSLPVRFESYRKGRYILGDCRHGVERFAAGIPMAVGGSRR